MVILFPCCSATQNCTIWIHTPDFSESNLRARRVECLPRNHATGTIFCPLPIGRKLWKSEAKQKAVKKVVTIKFIVDVFMFSACHTFQNVHPNQLWSLWPGPDFAFQIVFCLYVAKTDKQETLSADQTQEWGNLEEHNEKKQLSLAVTEI